MYGPSFKITFHFYHFKVRWINLEMNKLSTRLCILHTRRSSVFFKMNMVYMYDISLIGLYTLVNNIVYCNLRTGLLLIQLMNGMKFNC